MDMLDDEFLSLFQRGIGTGAGSFAFEAFGRRHFLLERVLIGWKRVKKYSHISSKGRVQDQEVN